MATAGTLRYYPPPSAASLSYSQTSATTTSPRSFFADFNAPPQLANLRSQWSMPSISGNTFNSPVRSPVVPPGTVVAANVESNHGKIHKRAVQKQSRGKSKHEDFQSAPDVALARTKTPPASAGASPINENRSPSIKSAKRGILKQNLRKLSHYYEDNGDHENTIDLSRTAEENEERSGLGITTSRSTSDIRSSAAKNRGHTRSHSHNSQFSTTSGLYQPTVPYVLPLRDSIQAYTPPLHRSHTGSIERLDFGDVYTKLVEDPTLNSTTDNKPRLRINTSATTPPAVFRANFSQNPSLVSLDRTSTRPRRSTNASVQAGVDGTMTPKSKISADARAFSFLSRPKDKDDDMETDASLLRLNSIQAARQAFEDREEQKARKYELQEQKAQDRHQRKIAKIEERKRRKSDATTVQSAQTPTAAGASPWDDGGRMDFLSGGEYASVDSLALPNSGPASGPEHAAARAMLGLGSTSDIGTTASPTGKAPRTSKRLAARTTYVQFLTWMRTKFLNADRRRRRRS